MAHPLFGRSPISQLVVKALAFAERAHAGQQRKFTGEPYINHPLAVLALVRSVPHTIEMECAALLHDTVEDTGASIEQIVQLFGGTVAQYVAALTNDLAALDRAAREHATLSRLAAAPREVKTIKLADVIDNTYSVAERDAAFAVSYMREKRRVLEVLRDGDATLYATARGIIDGYFHSAESSAALAHRIVRPANA